MAAETDIQRRLFALADPVYRDFQCKLTPTVAREQVIGVRIPALRGLAKELRGTDEAAAFLRALPHAYYDENNLHSFLVSSLPDYGETVAAVDAFLPFVDNWATCDSLSPKAFKKQHAALWDKIPEWLASGRTYTVRFGVGMLMAHFLDGDFREDAPARVAALRSDEYYVNMMCGWYMATALAKQPAAAMPYFTDCLMNETVWKMAVRKSVESFRVPDETKKLLRTLRYGK